MDQQELIVELGPFLSRLAKEGRPISEWQFYPVYPGDDATSYVLQLKAPWFDEVGRSQALTIVLDAMWETIPEGDRVRIFAVDVVNRETSLRGQSELKKAA